MSEKDNEKDNKRRVRLATIAFNQVWDIVARRHPARFYIAQEFELPDDCRVRTVWADQAKAAFVFLLESDSFDEVEDCVVPPEHPVKSRLVEIAVAVKQAK